MVACTLLLRSLASSLNPSIELAACQSDSAPEVVSAQHAAREQPVDELRGHADFCGGLLAAQELRGGCVLIRCFHLHTSDASIALINLRFASYCYATCGDTREHCTSKGAGNCSRPQYRPANSSGDAARVAEGRGHL